MVKDPQLISGEHTRLACLFRRLAETNATIECETKFTNTRGACAPCNLRPTGPPIHQYEEKLPGTWGRPAARLILVRFYGLGTVEFNLGGASIVIQHGIAPQLVKQLWLAVNEVVHHDDIMSGIIVWSRSNVAGLDVYQRDAGVTKRDAEEG